MVSFRLHFRNPHALLVKYIIVNILCDYSSFLNENILLLPNILT